MRICYYVSDHGWGHAARSVAIIRKLLATRDGVEVIVKADYALGFMQSSLKSERVKFDRCNNDFGFVLAEGSLKVDAEKTEELLVEWLSGWDAFIEKEKRFCREHDVALIISDIAPQPFLVANSLEIPGLAISNFTWYGVYRRLFGDTREVAAIREAYEHADLALILPLAEKNLPFKRKAAISLVARKLTLKSEEARHRLDLSSEEKLVYVGLGMSVEADVVSVLEKSKSSRNANLKFLVPSNARISTEGIVRIPPDETESQNYIAACDLVVSKVGYSTVSEAISGKAPMLLAAREGVSEDESILEAVESLGIAKRISGETLLDGSWVAKVDSLLGDEGFKEAFDNLPGRYVNDGCEEAASCILGQLS